MNDKEFREKLDDARRQRKALRQMELDLAYEQGYEDCQRDMQLDHMFLAPIGTVFYAQEINY